MRLRCESCGGKRTVLGFGGLKKACVDCDGTGWEKPQAVESKEDALDKRSKEYRDMKKTREA